MYARVAALAVLLIVVGCGGSPATQPPATPGPNTAATPPAGASIDSTAITAAVAALGTHDSWTFTVTAIKTGAPTAVQLTLTGTQRTSPQTAVSATLAQAGTADKRYTRIVDDIWYDAGTGTYVQTTAADAPVVAQFEPYYLNNLASAAETNGYTYNPVGPDTVSGISAMHYRLSQSQLQSRMSRASVS